MIRIKPNAFSFLALLICAVFIINSRFSNVHDKEISFDVLGYYMYLPATFIHGDPLLEDISWLEQKRKEGDLAGTLYMVSHNQDGEPMYFFLMGMSVFYLPWFLIGHAFAYLLDLPPDGFSTPYVYALIFGGIFYTFLGLLFIVKLLRKFFTDKLTAILSILFMFGTNTVHHLIAKDLETVNVLFMLCAAVFYFTIKWHESFKRKFLIAIGVCIALMTLVKPSEILIGLLPVFYGVWNWRLLKQKLLLIWNKKTDFLITISVGLVILLPQMVYWMIKVGKPIHDSYYNPGVGIDWWSPHTLDVLFSYRKGWLVYTPLMIFALIGFYFWRIKDKASFSGGIIYFSVSFYIMSCWTEWWYGSSFSCRPVITLYPILFIALGAFLEFIWDKKGKMLYALVPVFIFFIYLNQFQWWQFKNYILHDYSMSKEYYWKTFLKRNIQPEDKKLLSFTWRPKTYAGEFNENEYAKKTIESFDITNPLEVNDGQEYFHSKELPYKEITDKDHIFVKGVIEFEVDSLDGKKPPGMTICISRRNGVYRWIFYELKGNKIEFTYLTPPIREVKDVFKTNFSNPDKVNYKIISRKLEFFEPLR